MRGVPNSRAISSVVVVSSKFRVMWLCLDVGLDPQPKILLSQAFIQRALATHVIWFGWG
jgi:hypothetical protein